MSLVTARFTIFEIRPRCTKDAKHRKNKEIRRLLSAMYEADGRFSCRALTRVQIAIRNVSRESPENAARALRAIPSSGMRP